MLSRSKTVVGSDDRTWIVRRNMEWHMPAVGEEFEHDVDGGHTAAVFILGTLALFYLALFAWMPADVHTPWWMVIIGLAVLGFFPVRWMFRRPWKLVAETPGSHGLEQEHWQGLVRGYTKARDEYRVVIRMIRTRGTPAYSDSPLQPIS